jgi:hypothetical protein
MKIFYDSEFLESGPDGPVRLISIGLVREDGQEYYAVSEDATKRKLRRRIKRNDWLMANVVPSLPKFHGDANLTAPGRWLFNYSDPCVKPRYVIAREVRDLVLEYVSPQLWADWCSYDHVVMCQLFGRMIDLPSGFPMFTNDLRQVVARVQERRGPVDLPSLPHGRAHNALDDARELKMRYEWLAENFPEAI